MAAVRASSGVIPYSEHANAIAGTPRVGQSYFLDVQLAGEPIGPVNHEAVGFAVVERHERGGEPWAVFDAERSAERVVFEDERDVVAVGGGPVAAGGLLGVE